jgi:hypothetical protein
MEEQQASETARVREPAAPAPQPARGTIVVLTSQAHRGASVRVEPPDQPWQYAPVTEDAERGGARYAAIVSDVPAGTCWVHLEGAESRNLRSTRVTVAAGGIVELDWR